MENYKEQKRMSQLKADFFKEQQVYYYTRFFYEDKLML